MNKKEFKQLLSENNNNLRKEIKKDTIEAMGQVLEEIVLPKIEENKEAIIENKEAIIENKEAIIENKEAIIENKEAIEVNNEKLDIIEKKLDIEIERKDNCEIKLEDHEKRIIKTEKVLTN